MIFMIRHVLLFKFYKDVSEEKKVEAITVLKSLGASVPEVREWSIGRQCRPSEKNWDVAEVSSFENLESLDRFRNHPEHKRIAEMFSKISDWHIVDYEV